VIAGLGAIVVLLVLLIGPPVALVAVFGLPIPHTAPSASLFTHQLQAAAVLKACSVVVWLAWLQLVWCVVAELAAAVRNVGMPRRVPLAGGMQAVVHRLVTTALLVSAATTVAPALAPAAALAATPPAAAPPAAALALAAAGSTVPRAIPGKSLPTSLLVPPAANGGSHRAGPLDVSREYQPGRPARGSNGTKAAPDGERAAGWAHRTEKVYVVKPPAGRFHESLWEIAENHLGDGRRYREIFELNKDRPQPDGSMLTIASLIRPGWVLRMPHDASGPGIEVVKASPPARHSGRPHDRPPSARRSPAKHAAQPPPAPPPAPAPRTAPASAAASPAAPARAQGPARNHARSPAYPLELAAAGLLAAGVLAALERRRRRQARRRPPGRRVVTPPPDAAQAELALRLGEDEASARLLDTGLRYLGQALRQHGRTPPTVFAAHIGADNLDLWVDPPDHDVPRPWYAVGDGQVWRLPLADVSRLDAEQAGQGPALYPGLVTVGTDATGRVLVDLEAARGLIAVTGPDELVAEVLAAMAAELATSRRADAMHLTLVGDGEDIEVLAPARVEVMSSVAETLPLVQAHTAGVSNALADTGARSVLAGRAEELTPEAWSPHYLVALSPPAEQEAHRLAELARSGHPAAGYLVAGEVPGAAWTWEITPDGRLRAPELGLDVTAQHIPHEQLAAMAGLFDAADDVAGALMSAPPVGAAPTPGATAPAEVTLLGPVCVRALGDIEASMVPLATEIVVYLAAHPGGAYPNALAGAVWPEGVADEIRDGVLAAVARWLGTDGIGRPHLAADASGRLRLGSGVNVDWHAFLTLVGQAAGVAGGKHGQAREEAKLAQALGLVTGQFLAGIGSAGYAWIGTDGLEYEVAARVADAAHRLCELRLAGGDPPGAMDAVRTALQIAPDDELLWRDLLTAAHATGQEDLVYAAASEVWAQACLDGPPPGMAPETEALLDEVLPTWRWTLA
jgi:nucleoid-associated protein YgaU